MASVYRFSGQELNHSAQVQRLILVTGLKVSPFFFICLHLTSVQHQNKNFVILFIYFFYKKVRHLVKGTLKRTSFLQIIINRISSSVKDAHSFIRVSYRKHIQILEFKYTLSPSTYRSRKLLYLTFLGLATRRVQEDIGMASCQTHHLWVQLCA